MQSKQNIEQEIAALEACKSYIPKETAFGDNNHRNIDLQVEELRFGIDNTAGEWDEFSDSEQSAILEARDWKNGDVDEPPSSVWDHYKPTTKNKESKT